ncbi:hypothetical protein IFM89_020905 [Coptis chinensis]|uniref:eRF1/Pelota-like N-terminal domain-containing protein n=1 Tax=Coptis chinensis TaxID=261450 RepID=A0A835HMI9_9MAGN|nr:hypothetical protein IFM89_020905 [Coptis chinensis]
MKLSIKDEFTVKFVAEEEDDLWSVYNLICKGDRVEAETSRKMDSNGIRKNSATRVKVKVEIKVAKTEYDKVGSVLNISGNIVSSDTASVRIGGSHTLKIKQQLSFELTKNVWKESVLEQLTHSSCGCAELAVVLMQQGLADIFLVGKSGAYSATHCAKVRGEKPRGKKKSAKNSSSTATANSFFETVLKAFTEHVDLGSLTTVVLASPGTLKDEFHRYLIPEARSLQLKPIVNKKVRFVLISSTSQSLKEVLDSPALKKSVNDRGEVEDSKIFNDFNVAHLSDMGRSCYGWESVRKANELCAIQTLLVTEDLYKSSDEGIRRKHANLAESVKQSGGSVHVFYSGNASGVQLRMFTGIAAVLCIPQPDLDDLVL